MTRATPGGAWLIVTGQGLLSPSFKAATGPALSEFELLQRLMLEPLEPLQGAPPKRRHANPSRLSEFVIFEIQAWFNRKNTSPTPSTTRRRFRRDF